MRALLLALAIAFPAQAATPGFFRDPGDRTLEHGTKVAGFQCAMTIRYDIDSPSAIELSGLTVPCYSQMKTAFQAAQGKVFVLGEPAWDPQYDCAIAVWWNTPLAPTVTTAGATGCQTGRAAALQAAAAMG